MKLAWLFPGQGTQAVGMGKDAYEQSQGARSAFEEADRALGESLSKLCFAGPLAELTLTTNTQPAIVATSMALLAALREAVPGMPEPAFAAGHSLGEYSALCAAGALGLGDAVKICRIRGSAMQRAVPEGTGAMAAVMNLDGAEVAAACREALEGAAEGEVVSCANFNAPSQTVIAGSVAAVARAGEIAKERGGKVIPLNVSAPFHCALMAPAKGAVSEALMQAEVRAPRFPVIANVDAEPKSDGAAVQKALVDQVDSPVQWVRTIEKLGALGVTHALEIGPGRVLSGLARRIDKNLEVLSVGGLEAIERVPSFLGMEPRS